MERILIIEDELPMRTVLADCLERHGYRVLSAADGGEGLEKALREKPDLALVDVMMPRLDGFALCKELRRLESPVAILVLTAKGKIEDRVKGLDLGADDFLAKPFSREELLARIRALLRRRGAQARALKTFSFGDVRIDFVQQRVWRKGALVSLTAKEFSALRLLAERAGQPVTREQFLDLVWGYAAFPTTRTVDKHMASLRAKIGDNPEQPRWIQTVHSVGYRLNPEN